MAHSGIAHSGIAHSEIAHSIMAQNSVEYVPVEWDHNMVESLPELAEDYIPGKYKSTVTTILSKHCLEIKSMVEDIAYTHTQASKKKLKELITKHNDELFLFMMHPEKLPNMITSADAIFRKYGRDPPTIKGHTTQQLLKDLHLDMSMNHVMAELNEGIQKLQGEGKIDDFMKQLRWIFHQYRAIGEEVIRLETNLFQKMEMLDKLYNRNQIVTGLSSNEALPELIEAFTKYTNQIYASSQFEDIYKALVEEYKKWNICRQVISASNLLQPAAEPQCTICLLEPISSAIVPCGHTFCGNCTKKQNTTCYICRGQIRERVKLYFT
jgi:hypothetical protein